MSDRRTYFLAAQHFTKAQPNLLKVVIEVAKENGEWAAQHPREIAQQFAKDVKVDASALETVYRRRSWIVQPVTADCVSAQQQVADLFYSAQVIPKAVQVKDAFLPQQDYAKIFPS